MEWIHTRTLISQLPMLASEGLEDVELLVPHERDARVFREHFVQEGQPPLSISIVVAK